MQAQQAQGLPNLQDIPMDPQAKAFVQSAMQDVFSALAYSSTDQQKVVSQPQPDPGAPVTAAFFLPCMTPSHSLLPLCVLPCLKCVHILLEWVRAGSLLDLEQQTNQQTSDSIL
jgi:hypothetical protein